MSHLKFTHLCVQFKHGRYATAGQCDQIEQLIALWAIFVLPKSPTFHGNLCKGVKIFHFSSGIIFVQLYWSHCCRPTLLLLLLSHVNTTWKRSTFLADYNIHKRRVFNAVIAT